MVSMSNSSQRKKNNKKISPSIGGVLFSCFISKIMVLYGGASRGGFVLHFVLHNPIKSYKNYILAIIIIYMYNPESLYPQGVPRNVDFKPFVGLWLR